MSRSDFRSKIVSLKILLQKLKKLRAQNKKIVFTNGCFDVLHVGHVTYLAQAASLGDILVVGINSDASVRRLKGSQRPVCKEKDRATVLSALQSVGFVCFFGEDTPEKLIHAVKPDYLVKGGDWKKHQIVGSSFVETYGGKVRSLPFVDGFSTTGLLQKIQKL